MGTGCLSGVILALELELDAEKCTRIRGASAQTGPPEGLTSLGLLVFVLTRTFRYNMFAQKRAAAMLSVRVVERWTETFRRVQICANVFASVSPMQCTATLYFSLLSSLAFHLRGAKRIT